MSKGDAKRPTMVTEDELERRWNLAFGGDRISTNRDGGLNPPTSTK